jgi:hypothetical protein
MPVVLEAWLALEAVFYLLVYLPRKNYLQTVVTHPAASRDGRRRLFWRCHSNIPDPDRYLTKWFRDAPVAEIIRENVEDFFRWAFLNSGKTDPAYDEELEEYIGEMEKLLGRKLEPHLLVPAAHLQDQAPHFIYTRYRCWPLHVYTILGRP